MAIKPIRLREDVDPEPDGGYDSDDDARSDISSEIDEFEADDFPTYFVVWNGRLFHSHGGSPYPLPVDAVEQYVSIVT